MSEVVTATPISQINDLQGNPLEIVDAAARAALGDITSISDEEIMALFAPEEETT